jgi:hypothetical protein
MSPMGTARRGCGCIKGILAGCLFIVVMIFGLLFLVLMLGDWEFNKQSVPKRYELENLRVKGNMIESSFTWKYVDNQLNKWEPTLKLRIAEKDVVEALRLLDNIERELINSGYGKALEEDAVTEERARLIWSEIYHIVYRKSTTQMEPINRNLNLLFQRESMSAQDRLLFLISFVQNIKYEIPKGDFGFFPPVVTLAHRFGDCDTKALLLYHLLRAQGVACVMLWSGQYQHAMLGIKTNASGDYKLYKGEKYYFCEVTYPNWSVGQLPPEVGNPDYWFADDLESKHVSLF